MTGKPSLKCLTAFLCLLLINASYLFAQEKIVTGKIKDPQGNPLPGVNVNVWGSRQSVTADVTGAFSIPVPSETSTLVFSFVGFLQKEVKVGDQKDIQVTMAYDNADLDQVVVVGYGSSRRRDLTGSVYSVKPGMITQTPTFNALEALQGRVPGLDITRNGGNAGAGVNIQVRGQRTLSLTGVQAQPLYIIDGFQVPASVVPNDPNPRGGIGDLNPNDIESIEVLRDASATAIYGWMGANGVIIVTTKKGKDRPKVSYSGYYGVNGYVAYPKPRMGEEYVKLRREAYKTANNGALPADDAALFTNANEQAAFKAGQWVDWLDLVQRNGTEQSHTASIQSGGDKTKVFFSTGYYKEEGILRGNDMTRYNARLNYDQRISNAFKAGLLTQVTYSNTNNRSDANIQALTLSPLGKPYDSLGNINVNAYTGSGKASPLSDERPNAYKNNKLVTALTANGYLEITPANGLTLRSNLGTTLTYFRTGIFADSLTVGNYGKPVFARRDDGFSRFYTWDNILTFTRKVGDHGLTLTALTTYSRSDDDNLSFLGWRQIAPSTYFYAIEGSTPQTYSTDYAKATTFSYAGRFNYSYKGKYLLTATMRADGVSRLSENKKWDYFPSAAIGWNIHQEGFMQNALFVNNLKLRASYGIAGNASLGAYSTQNVLNVANTQAFGNVTAPRYYFGESIGNEQLGWEKTASTNLAMDFAFFKSRVFGSVEVYKAKTTDIIFKRALPPSTGRGSVWQNLCETENKGLEVAISTVNVNSNDFRWTSALTYTSAREEISSLIDGKDIIGDERSSLLLGHPIGSFYTYKKLGIWQNSDEEKAKAAALHWGTITGPGFSPGDFKLEDINGDNVIDASDRTFIGSTVPKWYAGFQNTFTYKNFELSVYLFARWGQTIYAEFMGRYTVNGTDNGPAKFDYWTPDNPSNDFPRPKQTGGLSSYNGYQTLNYIDGSYFKVKTVRLSYTLPASASRRLYSDRISIYVTGNNIYTKAKNKYLADYDPERGGQETSPLTRQLVAGVNVDF
jgi:TonB-linked SusC/RagA family outer membrane protein